MLGRQNTETAYACYQMVNSQLSLNGHLYKTIRMQGTVNENAASIRRICQRSNQPKMKSTIRQQGLTTA